ncbi:MAG: lysoplasmalogenase [Acidimicrobiia bacterium]|nr:lysoplasmalogenase [Acidimicrobiia bacterium]
MNFFALLSIPAVLGVIGYTTDFLPAKLGVPGACALILIVFYRRHLDRIRDFWWVVGAFAFSMVGDAFLSNKGDDEMMFVYGIGGFFLAHIGYLGFPLLNGRVHRVALIALYAGYIPFYFWSLRPAIDDAVLSVAVLIYLLISCLVLAAAFGLRLRGLPRRAYIAGIALIVISDTFIAFNEFLDFTTFNELILPTYYLAHITITAALIKRGLTLGAQTTETVPAI